MLCLLNIQIRFLNLKTLSGKMSSSIVLATLINRRFMFSEILDICRKISHLNIKLTFNICKFTQMFMGAYQNRSNNNNLQNSSMDIFKCASSLRDQLSAVRGSSFLKDKCCAPLRYDSESCYCHTMRPKIVTKVTHTMWSKPHGL